MGVAALAGAWLAGAPARVVQVGWLVLALGIGALTFYELTRVHDCAFFVEEVEQCVASPSYGPGLFVALVGAGLTVVAAVAALLRPGSAR